MKTVARYWNSISNKTELLFLVKRHNQYLFLTMEVPINKWPEWDYAFMTENQIDKTTIL